MEKRRIWGLILLSALAACRREKPIGPALVISLPFRVDSLDPHAVNSLSYFALASNIYEPLVTTDADMQIHPCLARRWENPDPTTWLFQLRTDAKFHSGRPLTAGDVVYSINRVLGDPSLEMGGFLVRVAEAREVDAQTVRLRTALPVGLLLAKLRFLAIVPRGATARSLEAHPDGTGPYRFESWRKGREVVLARNAAYWGHPPAFARVAYHFGRTAEEALRELRTGQAQIAQCNSKRPIAALVGDSRWRVVRRTSIVLKFLGFDLARSQSPYVSPAGNPFLDRRVRQAIDVGLDRRSLVEELPTFAVPANQLVPPFIHGYDPSIAPARHDLEAARRLLREAGYPDGFRVRLDTREIYAEAAEIVRAQLARIGITADIHAENGRDFFRGMASRDVSLALAGIGCPTGDLSDVLDFSFHSADPARHFGGHNFMGYSESSVDQEIERSSTIDDLESRRAVLQSLMRRLMEELDWVPLYVDEDVFAVDRRISWKPRPDGMVLAAEAAPAAESADR